MAQNAIANADLYLTAVHKFLELIMLTVTLNILEMTLIDQCKQLIIFLKESSFLMYL